MRVTCERCLRRYDVPDATVKGRKIRARCKCGARVVVQDEERAAKSSSGQHTTGSIQRPVRWFVDITSWEPIAMDLRQLVRAFDAGRIDAETLVWRKGMPDWRRLREVPELADRLIGNDGTLARGTDSAPAPSDRAAVSGSEPPPRQSERSRTPPANYSVHPPATPTNGAALPPAAAPVTSVSPNDQPPRAENPEPAKAPAPTSRAPRAKAAASPAPMVAPPQQRTITQTGLAAPMEAARAAAASGGPSRTTASEAGAPRAPSRNPTPPGGQRRPSSDETPAQKPSSISVPPGTLANIARPRQHRRIAAAALLVAGVILVQRWVVSGPSDVGPAVVASPTVTEQPARAEEPATVKEQTAEGKSVILADPAPSKAAADLAPAKAIPVPSAPSASPVEPATTSPGPNAPASLSAAVEPPKAPKRSREPAVVSSPSEAKAKQAAVSAPAEPKRSAPAPSAEAPAPSPATAEPAAKAPQASGSSAQASAPAPEPEPEPSPSSPPAAAAPAAPAPSSPPAASFDAAAAEDQMRVAAYKASTCGELGPTRGRGQVNVQIEKWGRVVRVTHLNQAFVGTPVGLCVMQAFQQVRVPAFEGTAQNLTGSFAVE